MATELALHIESTPMCDTHEHQWKEQEWIERGPDILGDLFGHYVPADLIVAGAAPEAVQRLVDPGAGDIAARFNPIRAAWEAIQCTGYGEAVRLKAQRLYGLDELTLDGLAMAQERLNAFRRPGERLRLLRQVANLDHIQTDDFCWPCLPDPSGPDFFLYDLSWWEFCSGNLNLPALAEETGITVAHLGHLRDAMACLFERYAPCAIAVKAQHAYSRTLRWRERSDHEAALALDRVLADPQSVDEETRLTLGDWCWARGVELATEHNLPFKLHTGYYAGTGHMPVDRIPAGNLCDLLTRYPEARFVLMHIAYPYNDELVALAKRYPNVWVDLCWAWSIDPYSSADFVRRFLHAVPANKLFGFGGDTRPPTSAVAYAWQARRWLTRALEAEVAAGDMTEKQAMRVATRLLRGNQYACFDIEGTRAAIKQRMEG
ncbi:MAG: amidohydrolase family protein [Armatimonadetes bacterium]|nr:amidohydrolase family protein [Armatimonadota bacterium]